MSGDPWLLLRLLAAMMLTLGVATALSRALGRPLRSEVALASIALPVVLLAPWLWGDRTILPVGAFARTIPGTGIELKSDPYARLLNDVVFQLAPWELEVRRQLAGGHLPLWSDRIDGGSSLWADPQASVVTPTSIGARLLPARHHFLAALALKIQLALCGTWAAARTLGVRRRAALPAAIAFALGGGILAWGLFPISAVAAWAPWVFTAALRLARRTAASRPAWIASVAVVTASMLSGHPELAFATGTLAAVLAAVFGRRGRRLRAVLRLALAGSLAFGLAAPTLVPFVAVALASQRYQDRAEDRARPSSLPPWHRTGYPNILSAALSPRITGDLPYERDPRLTNLYAHSGYAGLVTVAAVALALAARTSRRRALPFVLVAFVTYAFAARAPGFASAWEAVPLLQIQAPTRLAPLGALLLVLAAAIGIDAWTRRPRRPVPFLAAMLGLAVAVALEPAADVVGIGAGIGLSLLLAARAPRLSILLMALVVLVDLVPWGRRLLPLGDPRLIYPETADVATLRRAAGGPGGRVVGHDYLVYPATLSVFGLSDPRTHNPLAGADYHEVLTAAFDFRPSHRNYFARFRNPEHSLLDFLGVRAVVSNVHLPAIPGTGRIPLTPPFLLAVNREALPRVFVTRDFEIIEKVDLPRWIAGMTDPKRVALFDEVPVRRLRPSRLRQGGARVVRADDARLTVEVTGRGPRLLATSFRGPEGWRARSDGERLDTVTVNGAFLGVVVRSKTRRVELVYRPPGLAVGLLLAAVSVLTSALLLGRFVRPPSSPRDA